MAESGNAVTATHVALVAPVPLVHLVDGCQTCATQGKVAFGSRAWETFRELDVLRKGMPVDVYLYASHADGHHDFEVSWRGRYIRHVESIGGAHPDQMQFRPPSTASNPSDNSGHWAVFWEVEDLEQLPVHQRLALAEFTGFGKAKAYGHSFPPEGPLLVEHP